MASQFFESLESRSLLSASPALVTLKADAKALTASVVAFKKVTASDAKLIKADLKAAGETKSSSGLVKTLSATTNTDTAAINKSVSQAIGSVRKDVNKGVGIVTQLLHKPGNSALEAKLSAAITALQTDAPAGLAAITAALGVEETTGSANLTALAIANPTNTQLATDVGTTIPADSHAAFAAIATDANILLVTDVAGIVAEAEQVV